MFCPKEKEVGKVKGMLSERRARVTRGKEKEEGRVGKEGRRGGPKKGLKNLRHGHVKRVDGLLGPLYSCATSGSEEVRK